MNVFVVSLSLIVAVLTSCSPPSVNGLANGNCGFNPETGLCECIGSPIVLDLAGDGIHLTSPKEGVKFSLSPGHPRLWSWTQPDSDDAWLVFDRDQSGSIDDGSELFGDYTPQPESDSPNGFAALGMYDVNRDGVVDVGDSVWPLLRLWRDSDHDGVSQSGELTTLESSGVRSVSVRPDVIDSVDGHGNQYRYSATVVADAPVGEVAVDVWLRSTARAPRPESVSYKCWGWGYYRNYDSSDICSRVYVLGDPIRTDGAGRLSRFVARYAVRSTEAAAVTAANATVQAAANITVGCFDPTICSDYCSPPIFPTPDLFRSGPYWSIFDPNVWQRASCDPGVDDTPIGTGGGTGTCEG